MLQSALLLGDQNWFAVKVEVVKDYKYIPQIQEEIFDAHLKSKASPFQQEKLADDDLQRPLLALTLNNWLCWSCSMSATISRKIIAKRTHVF